MKKFLSIVAILSLVFSPVTPALADSSSTWNVNADGNWSVAGSWDAGGVPNGVDWIANLTYDITAPRTVWVNGVGTFTLGTLNIYDGSHDYTLSSSDGGILTFDVSAGNAAINQLALSGANTISASILINDSLDIVNAAATYFPISSTITANAAGTKTITNKGTGIGGVTLSGIIADGNGGIAAVTQNSATSALTLSGVNTYTGNTTISVGTLKLGNAATIPFASGMGDVYVNGTLDLNGYSPTVNGLFGAGIVDNVSAGDSVTFQAGSDNHDGSFSGVIQNTSGTVALQKAGMGVLTLSGANTYKGNTTIKAGTLKVGAANAIPTGSGKGSVIFNPTKNNTATLDINGFDVTVNGLSQVSGSTVGAYKVVNNAVGTSKTLTVGNDVASSTFAGILADNMGAGGTLGLTKIGSKTLTLSGDNTYTGITTVSAGTLIATGNATALGANSSATAVTMNVGGTLQLRNDTGLNFGRKVTVVSGPGYSEIDSGRMTLAGEGVTHTLSDLSTSGTLVAGIGDTLTTSGTQELEFGNVNLTGAATIVTGTTLNPLGVASGLLTLGNITSNGNSLIFDADAPAGRPIAVTMGTMANLSGGLTITDASGLVTVGALGTGAAGNITITDSQLGVRFSGTVDATTVAITDTADGATVDFANVLNVATGMSAAANGAYNVSMVSNSTIAGATTFANTGSVTFGNGSGHTMNFTNGVTHTAGTNFIWGNIAATNAAINLGNTTAVNYGSTLAAGSGLITLGATTLADGVTLTLGTGGSGGATVTSIAGTDAGAQSNVIFNTSGAVISGAVGTDIDALTVTNSGTANFNGAIDITGAFTQTNAATGATTFADTVSVGSATLKGTTFEVQNSLTSTGAVAVTNSGTFTKWATGAITTPGGFSTSGNANLANNVTTTNNTLSVGGTLKVADGRSVTLSTQGVAGAGDITITGNTDGTMDGSAETLILNSGTGSLTFNGYIHGFGGGQESGGLTTVTVTNAGTTNFNKTIAITGAFTQTNAATGATTFAETVSVGSAELKGTDFSIQKGFTSNSNGTVTITNSGLLTIAATGDMTLDGAFTQDGGGTVSTAGNITTTNDDITFTDAITLTGAVSFTSGTGIISLASVDNGGYLLTMNNNVGASSSTIRGILSGGGLTKAGAGTLTLSGDNTTYTGITTVSAGTLIATDNATALGANATAAAVTMNGGTLQLRNDMDLDFGRNVTVNADSEIDSGRMAANGDGVTHTLGDLSTIGTLVAGIGDAHTISGIQGLTFGAVTLTGAATILTGTALDPLGSASGLLTLQNITSNGNSLIFDADPLAGRPIAVTMGTMTDISGGFTIADATGLVTVGTLGAGTKGIVTITNNDAGVTFDAVTATSLTQAAGTGTTTFNGALNTTGANDTVGGAVNVTTAGAVDFNALATITTTGGTATAGIGRVGGNVTLNSTGSTVDIDEAITTSGSAAASGNSAGGAGGAVDIDALSTVGVDAITTNGSAAIGSGIGGAAGAVSLTGSAIILKDNITAIGGNTTGAGDGGAGGAITLASPVTLGAGITINTNGGAAGSGAGGVGGKIDFQGTLNGAFALELNAAGGSGLPYGVHGDIEFDGVVGGTAAPGAVTIDDAKDVTARAAFSAASLIQHQGTGTTWFKDTVSTSAAEGVTITSGAVKFDKAVSTTTGGTVTVVNSGVLTIALGGDMTLDGAFSQSGVGAVSTAGHIDTTRDDISFASAVTLTGNVALDTDNGTPGFGNITFSSTVNAAEAGVQKLTVGAGAGDIVFTGDMGTTVSIRDLKIVSATNVTAAAITALSITQDAGTGKTTFNGALTVNALGSYYTAIDLTGNEFTVNNTITTTGDGIMEITNAGLLTIAGAGDMTLDGSFLQNGGGTVSTAGNITTTNDDITFNGAVTLTDVVALTSGTGIISLASVDNGGKVLTVNNTGASNSTISGVVSNTGGLTKAGTGTLTLSNANTYGGTTTVSEGTLALSNTDSNNNIASSGTINVAGGAGLNVTGLKGADDLILANLQTLKGTGTVTGNLTVGSGSILAPGNSPGTLNDIGNVTYGSGGQYVWEINNATGAQGTNWDLQNITGGLTIGSDAGSTFTIEITSLKLADNTPGDAANFNKKTNYTWTIASTTTGINNFNASYFTLNKDNFTNDITGGVSNGSFVIQVSGTDLELKYNAAVDNAAYWKGDQDGKWNTVAGADTNWASGSGGDVDIGTLPGAANDVYFTTTAGSANWSTTLEQDFSIRSLTFTGTGTDAAAHPVTIASGVGINTLTLGTGGITVQSGSAAHTISSQVALGASESFTNNSANLFTVSGDIANGANTLTIAGSGDTTLSGVLGGGAGGLTKTGSGTLTLNGNNSYTGTTMITAGKLIDAGSIADSSDLTVNGATAIFDLGNNHSDTVGTVTLQGGGSITGTGTSALTSDADYDMQNGSVTAILAGAVGLNKTTADTVTLSGANTYTGTTNITAGKLIDAGSLSDSSDLTVNGATAIFDLGADHSDTVGTVTLQGGGSITGTGTSALTSDVAYELQNGSVTAILAGAVGLNKTTADTVTLSGANTYTGTTSVTAGKLIDAGSISDSSDLTVNGATAIFDLGNNHSDTVGTVTLQGGGSITGTGTSALTSDAAYELQNGSVTAILAGAVGLNKTTADTVTLSGVNTYTGLTTVGVGVLKIQDGSALGTADAGTSVTSGAALEIDNHGTTMTIFSEGLTLNGTGIANGGALRGLGAGSTRYWGDIVLGSDVRINSDNGTLNLGDFWVPGTITGNHDLIVGGVTGAVINDSIQTGTGKLTVDGGATYLQSSTANTYTGLTEVSAGSLYLAKSTDVTAVAGDLKVSGTGSLIWNASNQVANTSTISMTSGRLDLNNNSDTIDAFEISDGIFVTGTGHLTCADTVTWSGGTNTINDDGKVSSNHIVITGGTNTMEGAGGALELTAGGAGLEMSNGSTLTLNSYAGANAGKLLLYGNVSTLGNATVAIASAGALATAGTIDLEGGTRTFTVADGTAATDLAISAAITNGGLTKAGAGILTLSGANTYTGTTTINAGTLELSGGSAILDAGAVALADVAGATLSLSSSETIGSLSGGGTTGGEVDLGSSTLTVGDSSDTLFAGNIHNISSGAIIKTGTGTLTLSGVNIYTGTTTINAGTLALSGGSAILDAGAVVLANVAGATLALNNNETIGSLSGGGSTGGEVDLGSSTLTVGDGNSTTFSGVIHNFIGGALTKTGAGTLTLSGVNTYTGVTTISAGTLSVATIGNGGVAGNLGQATNAIGNQVLDGGTLRYTGDTASTDRGFTVNAAGGEIDVVTSGKTLTINTTGIATAGTLTLGGAGNTTISSAISGAGGVTKDDAGNLTLSGANTYSGATNINGGRLQISAANNLGDASLTNTIGINGGILRSTANSYALGANQKITMTGAATIETSAGTLTLNQTIANGGNLLTVTGGGAANTQIAGVISGSGGLLQDGGTTTLSGDNTYTGVTTLMSGTLSVATIGNGGVSGNLGAADNAASNLIFESGVLRYTGVDASTDRNFTINNGYTATIDVSNALNTLTMSGASTATTGALKKAGAGTLTLSGANLYTGGTTVEAGTLDLNETLVSTVNFSGAGTVILADNKNITGAITTSADNQGILTIEGTSTFVSGIGRSTTLDLATINAGADGERATFKGAVYANALNVTGTGEAKFDTGSTATIATTTFLGAGTLFLREALTGNIVFGAAGDGLVKLADGKSITGTVDNTTGADIGTLTVYAGGNSSVGAIGATRAIKALNVSPEAGETATFTGAVKAATVSSSSNGKAKFDGALTATDLNITSTGEVELNAASGVGTSTFTGAGTLDLNETLTGNVVFGTIFGATGDGFVTLLGGKNITGTVDSNNIFLFGTVTVEAGGNSSVGTIGATNRIKALEVASAIGEAATFTGAVDAAAVTSSGAGKSQFDGALTTTALNITSTGEVELNAASGITTTTFTGAGTLDLRTAADLTGDVDFKADGNVVLSAGSDITGNITNTQGSANNGNITTEGASVITGTVGATGTGRLGSINANGAATTQITGTVFATDASVATGAMLQLDDNADITALNYAGDGTVSIAAGKRITGNITNTTTDNGTLTFLGAGTSVGNIGSTGAGLKLITVGNGDVSTHGDILAANINFVGDNSLNITGGHNITTSAGVTSAAGNQGQLVFNGTSICNAAIGNNAWGSRLRGVQVNAGTVTFNDTVFTNILAINGGTAVIGGSGTYGVTTLNHTNDSILDLGTYTLTFDATGAGNYTQGGAISFPILKTTIQSATVAGNIDATGAATGTMTTLAASTLSVTVPTGVSIAVGTKWTILDGQGVGSVVVPTTVISSNPRVTFAATATDGAGGVGTQDLELTVLTWDTANAYSKAATDGNGAAAGAALDSITNPSGDMLTVMNTLDTLSDAQIGTALDTMTPDVSSGAAEGSRSLTSQGFTTVSNRLGGARSGGASVSGVSSGDRLDGVGVWMQGLGSNVRQGERKGIEGYSANLFGTTIGADKVLDDHFRAGLAGSYGWARVKSKTPGSPSDDINSFQGTIYGSFDSLDLNKARQGGKKSYEALRSQVENSWYVDGMFAFTLNNYDSRREIWVTPTNKRVAKAEHYGQQYSTNFEAGYKFVFEKTKSLEVTPFVGLGYNYLYMNKYKENGANALNLSVDGHGFNQLEQRLGTKLAYPIVAKKVGTFIPSAKAAWLYDYMADTFETTASFAGGGASFNTVGAKPARNGMLFGAELAFLNKGNVTLTGNWDIELKDQYMSNTYYGTVRYDF